MNETSQYLENHFRHLPLKARKHCKRTGYYMRIILEAMDTLEMEEGWIWDGLSPLDYHDIGKVLLPPALIRQRWLYTREQNLAMMAHVDYGQQIFNIIRIQDPRAKEFCQAGEDLALYHHECWDGSGYPDGRQGGEIPFLARVCAVANAYDNICEGGIITPPQTKDDALAELKKGAGKWFDPQLCEALASQRTLGQHFKCQSVI